MSSPFPKIIDISVHKNLLEKTNFMCYNILNTTKRTPEVLIMKKISLFLAILIILSVATSLTSCNDLWTPPTINGVSLENFTIVYDFEGLDYNKRAAEYIQNMSNQRYGVKLEILDDSSAQGEHEIVVGETSRPISEKLEAECKDFEFAILANEGSVALEGDYFVIAAAAYFFMETYASSEAQVSTVPETVSVHEPIVKEAKNFILLIGDGMGVYQTKLFEYMENNVEYSDGEDFFYGYLFPYMGSSRTDSLSGTTDSAAGGTALACGIKTINGYIGRDENLNDVKSLTELAGERGKATAVMSTEVKNGATPASFSAHADERGETSHILNSIYATQNKYGTIIECGYNYYNTKYMGIIEGKVEDTLSKLSQDKDGFFVMYEEAYIDKNCHDNNMEGTFNALVRFNQVIARFMEFAFYNPETFVLITADHETGMLYPDEDGTLAYHYDDHSSADVLIFAYGQGAELFDGQNVENIQIAHTIAALMGEDNFGDQSKYQSLTKGNK